MMHLHHLQSTGRFMSRPDVHLPSCPPQALPAANPLQQPRARARGDRTGTAPCYSALFRDRKRYGIWIFSYELKLKPRLHSLGKSHFCKATAHRGWGGQSVWKASAQASALRQGLWPVHSSMTWRDDQPIHPMFCCIWPFHIPWMLHDMNVQKQCLCWTVPETEHPPNIYLTGTVIWASNQSTGIIESRKNYHFKLNSVNGRPKLAGYRHSQRTLSAIFSTLPLISNLYQSTE